MLKKLDILVARSFIGPFVATFFITLLVLLMQFFWLWIDDFVGKGVSLHILLEFIWYQMAVLVPLALPLAVLLSSIMTFGNLGESYELVAIKSAGISLLRFMRPLFFITLLICGMAFAFSNNVIPVANLKEKTLLSDIARSKPSFDIKEGVFYNRIPNFSIKIGKKVNDTLLKNIVIYEQTTGLQDNFIIATDGVMRSSSNKRYLQLILQNGWRYEERGTGPSTDYIKMGFKEYQRSFDISFLGLQRTSDTVNRNNADMLSMRQLNIAMDSIHKLLGQVDQRLRNEGSINFVRYLDSNWGVPKKKIAIARFDQMIPDSIRNLMNQRALTRLNNLKISNEVAISQYTDLRYSLRRHEIEWHRKITLSLACLVMFLIGAPLGSIIRKGGLGTPLIFAIVFFMLFYFSSTTGEKFSREGSWTVFSGMWLSTFILTPIGIFMIYKALGDSQLFSKEFYYRFGKKLRVRFSDKTKE